jgi:hypothetical protein
MFRNSAITPTATMGGVGMSVAHGLRSSSLHAWIFYGFPAGGLASSSALVVSHANTPDTIIGAASYLGVDSTGTVTAFNSGAASTAAWSSGNVAGNSGDALIGGAFVDNGSVSSSTPGGSANERIDQNVAGQSETLVFEDILSIAGTTALTGTWNAAGSHLAIAASFKPSAAAAVSLPILVMAPPIPA